MALRSRSRWGRCGFSSRGDWREGWRRASTLCTRGNRFGARLCAEHQPLRVTSTRVTEIFSNLSPELPLRLVSDTAALRGGRVEMRAKVRNRVLPGWQSGDTVRS